MAKESVGLLTARRHITRSRISWLRQTLLVEATRYETPARSKSLWISVMADLVGTNTATSLNFAAFHSPSLFTGQPSLTIWRTVWVMSLASERCTLSAVGFSVPDVWCAVTPNKVTAFPAGALSRIGTSGVYTGWLLPRCLISLPKTSFIQEIISGVLRKFVDSRNCPSRYFSCASRYRLMSARRNL